MRLITFSKASENRIGVYDNGRVIDLNNAYTHLLCMQGNPRARATANALVPPCMIEFLRGGEASMNIAQEVLSYVIDRSGGGDNLEDGIVYNVSQVKLRAPVLRPGKILCLGLNYRDHAAESGLEIPKEPVIFSKVSSSVIGPGEPIRIPNATKEVDYEVELAFVIGKLCKEVSKGEAYDYIAGYTILNDVSARDYQLKRQSGQWFLGKSFDTFAPVGPWIATKDEVSNPHTLNIRLEINGEELQRSNTEQLIFTIPEIVEYLSKVFTLEPGDVISTGTPSGVGFVRKPPRFLQRGDAVKLEIDRIGVLENPVE